MVVFILFACTPPAPTPIDADRDGATADVDCDDNDADVFPQANEFCDGRDNNCDGVIDEDAIDRRDYFLDADGDGFGDVAIQGCEQLPGWAIRGGDCDDGDPQRLPLAYLLDADGDGHGDPASALPPSCERPADAAPRGAPPDCDDADPQVHPGQAESCNGRDDNCDGLIDDADPGLVGGTLWFADADEDGFGRDDVVLQACEPTFGSWSQVPGDCDDFDAGRAPGRQEYCDGRDDDCDGVVDAPEAPLAPGIRLPIRFEGTGAGVVQLPVDLEALYLQAGGTDPAGLQGVRVDVGVCGTNHRELPARALADRLVVVVDEPLSALEGWLTFTPQGRGSVALDGGALVAGDVRLEVDPAGGLFGTLAGSPWFSQQLHRPGVQSGLGVLTAPTSWAVDLHPALSRLVADGVVGGGRLAWTSEAWVVSGREEVWVQTRLVAEQPLWVSHELSWPSAIRPFAIDLVGGATWSAPFGNAAEATVLVVAGPSLQPLPGGLVAVEVLDGAPPTRLFQPGEEVGRSSVVISSGTLLDAFTPDGQPTLQLFIE